MTTAILALRRQFATRPAVAAWAIAGALAALYVAVAARDAVAALLAGAASPVALGFAASAAAGIATGLGALPLLSVRRVAARVQDAMLGFGAGVMLAASCFSLILPGIEAAQVYFNGAGASLVVAAGVAFGALFLYAADRVLPHEHFIKGPEGMGAAVRRIWLFVAAITLHNLPEGLAVGVAFAGAPDGAPALALGIGIQNIPEGLVVALALAAVGYSKIVAVAVAAASGLVEPVGGLFGAAALSAAQPLLPAALAFAAGAMLYVVSHEIIPESHRKGHEHAATGGVIAGFVLMMSLDTALG